MFRTTVLIPVAACWLIMAVITVTAQQRQARQYPPAQWVDPDTSAPLGTRYKTFYSAACKGNVSYLILLPPDYEPTTPRRYPVVYWLHGRGGDQRTGVRAFLPQLISAQNSGMAPALIAVFVNGMRDRQYHDSKDGQWPVESMIMNDLIPHIDASYRTIPSREGRAVEGYSMGGYGTAYLGFKYSEIFGAVTIMAGAVFDRDSVNVDALNSIYGGDYEYWLSGNPLRILERNAARLRDRTRVRICVGGDDQLLKGNRMLDSLLTTLDIPHTFHIVPGVGHSSRLFYEKYGPESCAFYSDVFR